MASRFETDEQRLERLSRRIEVTSTGCWNWMGHRVASGYGLSSYRGRTLYAHRLMFQLVVGPIPTGLQLDHLCRVRHCVNPEHLEPVTGRENKLRGETFNAANATKTHCVNGHEFTPDNTRVRTRGDGTTRVCVTCQRAIWAVQNAKRRTNPARKYYGIYSNPRGRWIAKGFLNGKRHHLGTFPTTEEAEETALAWRERHLSLLTGRAS